MQVSQHTSKMIRPLSKALYISLAMSHITEQHIYVYVRITRVDEITGNLSKNSIGVPF